jgi:hypothetical protein
MKKIIFALLCALVSFGASAQEKLTVNAGFLFPSTLNATVGFEHSLNYGNAVELFGEIGDHWKSDEGRFWSSRSALFTKNGYYWDGGLLYKHRLIRYKNGMLRFRFGPQFGAVERKFFLGIEGGFEYNYVFQNGWEFSLIQKNNVNFIHGDTFRNGLLIGLKIPL